MTIPARAMPTLVAEAPLAEIGPAVVALALSVEVL